MLVFLSFIIAAAAAPAAQPQAPSLPANCEGVTPTSVKADLSGSTDSIFLPWTQPFSNTEDFRVEMNIKGIGSMNMATDTGSTGLIISKTRFTDFEALAEGAPTVAHYLSSSSRLYTGKVLNLQVSFFGKSLSDGSDMTASGMVPILAVETLFICPWYPRDSKPLECPERPPNDDRDSGPRNSTGVQYMGVGFGRSSGTTAEAFTMPKTNTFLSMKSITSGKAVPDTLDTTANQIRTGWIISTKGVVLGLTEQNTQNFNWQGLQPGSLQSSTEPLHWESVTATTQIDQKSIGGISTCEIDASCFIEGTVLVDTGLEYAFIRMPRNNTDGVEPGKNEDNQNILPNGTIVTTQFGSACNASYAGSYTFTVGGGSNVEPLYTRPLAFVEEDGSFINTGRKFLNGHDISFDAVGGRFGLRPAGASDGLERVAA